MMCTTKVNNIYMSSLSTRRMQESPLRMGSNLSTAKDWA